MASAGIADAGTTSAGIDRQARIVAFLFGCYLLFVFIGSRPYTDADVADPTGQTDVFRQLAGFAVTGLALVTLLLERRRGRLPTAVLLVLMAYAGFLMSSATWSDHPSFVIRRAGLFTLVTFALCVLSDYLHRARLLVPTLLAVMLTVLTIDTVSIVLLHGISIDHDGRWKGIHDHKNVAGSIMAAIAIVCGWLAPGRRVLWLPCLLATGYLAGTASKTSFALLFGSIAFTLALAVALRALRAAGGLRLLVAVPLLVVVAMSVDVAGLIDDGVSYLYGDVTFTGRVFIWDYVLAKHAQAPWLGYGFGSFWGMGDLTPAISDDIPLVRELGQAHNGYLDVLVQTGWVGVGLFGALLSVVLGAGLRRIATVEGDWQTDAMFLNIVFFALLHNLLESTFLNSLSVTWTLFLLSSVYLITAPGSAARRYAPTAPDDGSPAASRPGWQALHGAPG